METIGSMIKVLRHRNCPSLHCGESFKRPRLSLQATVMFQVSGCSWARGSVHTGISRGWLCCKYVVHTALRDLKPARVDKLIFNKVPRMIRDIMLRTFILFIEKFNIPAECLSGRSGSIQQCFWSNIYNKKWRQHQNWNWLNKTLFGKAFSDIVSCLQLVIGTFYTLTAAKILSSEVGRNPNQQFIVYWPQSWTLNIKNVYLILTFTVHCFKIGKLVFLSHWLCSKKLIWC